MSKFIIQLIAGILAIWLATIIVPSVKFEGPVLNLIFAGIVLGLLNLTIRPIVELITLPIKIITLGLFSLAIGVLMVWIVDILFAQLIIPGFNPLFWTSLINWGLIIVLALIFPKRKNHPENS